MGDRIVRQRSSHTSIDIYQLIMNRTEILCETLGEELFRGVRSRETFQNEFSSLHAKDISALSSTSMIISTIYHFPRHQIGNDNERRTVWKVRRMNRSIAATRTPSHHLIYKYPDCCRPDVPPHMILTCLRLPGNAA